MGCVARRLGEGLRGHELGHAPAFRAHIGKYRSLIPSLALLFHLIETVMQRERSIAVPLGALNLAIRWGDFLEAHARKLYARELAFGFETAVALLEHIQRGEVPDGSTTRDIYRNQWRGLSDRDEVAAALDILETYGWVMVQRHQASRDGGRATTRVLVHPKMSAVSGCTETAYGGN